MPTVLTFPADAVVNGATEIQSTTFKPIQADYEKIDQSVAQQLMASRDASLLRNFPRAAKANPNWSFYLRTDLVGSDARLRNIIGIEVLVKNVASRAFSPSLEAVTNYPYVGYHITVHNWHAQRMTLTSGAIVDNFLDTFAGMTVLTDPETGAVLTVDGNANALEECAGFLLTRVAADNPTFAPILNIIGGSMPLAA